MLDRIKQWTRDQREQGRELRTRTRELNTWVNTHKAQQVAEVAGLHVFPDRLITLPAIGNLTIDIASHPIAGATASLQQTGTVHARGTLTRAATVGGGWQKTVDDRTAWLQVDGPDYQLIINIPPQSVGKAGKVAAQITALGRQAAG